MCEGWHGKKQQHKSCNSKSMFITTGIDSKYPYSYLNDKNAQFTLAISVLPLLDILIINKREVISILYPNQCLLLV